MLETRDEEGVERRTSLYCFCVIHTSLLFDSIWPRLQLVAEPFKIRIPKQK